MTRIRKRLTYANVMSTIAVFLVVGGASAFAASQLGKNSVGTKQLKKNAVTAAKIKKNAITTAKIKKNAVTGAKVKESTLGTVPSATLASSIPPAEPTHLVGAPGEPPFESGSSNVPPTSGVNLTPVGFYKDHEGIVHLQGLLQAGEGASITTGFTLPPGYRPAPATVAIFEQFHEAEMIVGGSNTFIAGNDLSGKIVVEAKSLVSLEGVTFRAVS